MESFQKLLVGMMNFKKIQAQAIEYWKELQNTAKPLILVGSATCGRAAGALTVLDRIKEELSYNISAKVMQVGCIGLCYAEPLVDIIKPPRPRICYGNVEPEIVSRLVNDYIVNDEPCPDLALGTIGDKGVEGIPELFKLPVLQTQVRLVLRNCGFIDPENIDHYIATGGYSGLTRALEMKPEAVIEEIKKSGLRGRGGAGFPTGKKWEFCYRASGSGKYLICNADEGDPGAFMNRSLLEGDPHSILEGMLIGAYAIGADQGYIYCRAEYPLALERLNIAINQMKKYGLLGDSILDSELSFHIEIVEGAGAFVCGEETALMASIEGKRGMPRSRPPFPAISGLWGKPTNINNVETWANVSFIMQKGWRQFAKYGTEGSRGTKTFALAGKVERTGLVEVPFGITMREIIFQIGGGILGGKKFKAVQTGGPSGGCLPADFLDTPIDYESLAAAGSIIGSGGMIVIDESTCMVDVARYFLSFTQKESCGKCVLCREGTKQMLHILEDLTKGKSKSEDIELLLELSKAVKVGSLCGLGQTSPNPVLTTIQYFHDEYKAHINKLCPAKMCKELILFYILPDKCAGCGICLRACPVDAIKGGRGMIHIIEQDRCIKCGTCYDICPTKFKAIDKVTGERLKTPDEPIPVGTWKVT
jgi:NADH-quinone oxidoreductase subunit F